MPRTLRVIAPAALLAATLLSVIVGLAIGGGAAERSMLDPGAIVRYGLPISRTLVNVSIAGLIGSLVMALWAVDTSKREGRVALDLAAGSAAVLTVAAAATILFTYLDVSGLAFSGDAAFGAGLAQFLTEIELGQLWLIELLIASVTTVLCFAVRDRRWVILPLIAAIATVFPLANLGHAAGAAGHGQAVNALLVHLIGAAVWLGGLITVLVLARVVDRSRLRDIVARYSSLALFAFVGVAASGVASALLRIEEWGDLVTTGYGWILLLKTAALVALGALGALWRRRAIPKLDGPKGGGVFARLIVIELAVMGIASGLAGALGRTATPLPQEPPFDANGALIPPAEWLTGDPLPPELTPIHYFTAWRIDLLWLLVCVFGLAMYLAAVWRLHRRGDRWPIGRTVAWALGIAFLFYTTNGVFNVYERYLFSVHMLSHMLFTMLIPLVLVLGAPVTLALRAVRKRDDGSWGGREWIMWAVQTPFSRVVTHPAVAAVVFAGSLWVFYFTPILRWAMTDHLGHQWMIVHFLISGYLFALSMIGIDPVPYRFPYPMRIVTLFATMASHAFFGVTLMTGDSLALADWFGAMGRTWGAPPVADQTMGGGIAWGIGELPTLSLALIVAVQWSRSDEKEQRRRDRAADRSGDAELKAYNEMLAQRARDDEKFARSPESPVS